VNEAWYCANGIQRNPLNGVAKHELHAARSVGNELYISRDWGDWFWKSVLSVSALYVSEGGQMINPIPAKWCKQYHKSDVINIIIIDSWLICVCCLDLEVRWLQCGSKGSWMHPLSGCWGVWCGLDILEWPQGLVWSGNMLAPCLANHVCHKLYQGHRINPLELQLKSALYISSRHVFLKLLQKIPACLLYAHSQGQMQDLWKEGAPQCFKSINSRSIWKIFSKF
jgi:hypothetical protein